MNALGVVTKTETLRLTHVTISVIRQSHLAHSRGVTGDVPMLERVRRPRAGFVTPHPGGPGHRWSGKTTGLRGARWTGTGNRRVTPARAGSQETRPGAEPMLVATGVASAAAERREASAPGADEVRGLRTADLRTLVCGAHPRPNASADGDIGRCGADIGWMRLSALRSPSLLGADLSFVHRKARAQARRESACCCPSSSGASGSEPRRTTARTASPAASFEGRFAAASG